MLKQKLAQEMTKKGVSTRQVAKEIGTSHTTILRTLRGDIVDMATILKFSQWMGVKPSTLVDALPEAKSSLPEKIAVMLGNHPALENEFAKAVKALVEEKIDPAIVEDIAAYAAYKINLGISRR